MKPKYDFTASFQPNGGFALLFQNTKVVCMVCRILSLRPHLVPIQISVQTGFFPAVAQTHPGLVSPMLCVFTHRLCFMSLTQTVARRLTHMHSRTYTHTHAHVLAERVLHQRMFCDPSSKEGAFLFYNSFQYEIPLVCNTCQ